MTVRTGPSAGTRVPAGRAYAVLTWAYAAGFGGPAVPVSVYLLRRGSLPWFMDLFPLYGGPWSGRLRDRQFVGLLLSYLGLMVLGGLGRRAGPAQLAARGPGQRRAAAGRGRVLARIRTAHSVGPRCRPGGAARSGLATAARTPTRHGLIMTPSAEHAQRAIYLVFLTDPHQ